ncbi:MAG: FAD-binding oxidoreductase [Actinobacteria bacterium]|nr:FAD-binding oxidoreductase [Actinomycetota bacterium]
MTAPAELAEIVGEHRVSVHPQDLHRHSGDRSPAALLARRMGRRLARPLCVVRPRTTKHVAQIVEWANATKTPLVPYGGGSGVTDGIRPDRAVVVELRAMNEIRDFDEKSRLVRAECGVLGSDLDNALHGWGFMLGHQPQSIQISTVGGWVSTGAVGQLSSRYGGIEDLVAGMEAVLPDGRIVRTKGTPRTATGPDVASLLIGAEGTLGIVTEVTLRVSALPPARLDLCVRFEHMAEGVAACRKIAQEDLDPTMMRLYDRDDAAIFLRNHPDEPRDPFMILSFEGFDAPARMEEAFRLARGERGNDSLVDHWWVHRNDLVHEYLNLMDGTGLLGPHAMVETMEVSARWSDLRDVYHAMKDALGAQADIVGCHLSHHYIDGACLYFSIGSACDSDDDAAAKLESWWEAGMSACIEAGGSISHHHGIGRRRARWLPTELGGWWDVLVALKKTLDPNGIMNPGALGL